MVDAFIASFDSAPEELVLDFDATGNTILATGTGERGPFARRRTIGLNRAVSGESIDK